MAASRLARRCSCRRGESAGSTSTPAADAVPARRSIEASGQTLIPGLIDAHVHVEPWSAPLFLKYGVTSVRDVHNAPDVILPLDARRLAVPAPHRRRRRNARWAWQLLAQRHRRVRHHVGSRGRTTTGGSRRRRHQGLHAVVLVDDRRHRAGGARAGRASGRASGPRHGHRSRCCRRHQHRAPQRRGRCRQQRSRTAQACARRLPGRLDGVRTRVAAPAAGGTRAGGAHARRAWRDHRADAGAARRVLQAGRSGLAAGSRAGRRSS